MILYTHNDLDAAGCELCLRRVNEPERVFYEDYVMMRDSVSQIVSYGKLKNTESVVIADLSFAEHPEHLQSILDNFKTVIHIDHHSYPENFSVTPRHTFRQIIDEKRCACRICYDSFRLEDQYLKDLITVIDKFDRWQENDPEFPEALDLNAYFWEVGYSAFMEGFKTGYPKNYREVVDSIHKKTEEALRILNENHCILRDRLVTVHIGNEYFIPSQIREFNNGQKGFLCVLKNLVRVRLSQKYFNTERAEKCRALIQNKINGHPHAFVVQHVAGAQNSFAEAKRISDIINSF